jgi:hypothetical protein|tara:strand:- start:2 stop:262 length:261 start_codon:yes stop_codon:yes gene_type:complete
MQIQTKSKPGLLTLKEAAEYCNLTPHSFRHAFYNHHNKQNPKPTYLGKEFVATKTLSNVTRDVKAKSMLRFCTTNLDAWMLGEADV